MEEAIIHEKIRLRFLFRLGSHWVKPSSKWRQGNANLLIHSTFCPGLARIWSWSSLLEHLNQLHLVPWPQSKMDYIVIDEYSFVLLSHLCIKNTIKIHVTRSCRIPLHYIVRESYDYLGTGHICWPILRLKLTF